MAGVCLDVDADDMHLFRWSVILVYRGFLNLMNGVHSGNASPKYGVLAVQPRTSNGCHKKLGP